MAAVAGFLGTALLSPSQATPPFPAAGVHGGFQPIRGTPF